MALTATGLGSGLDINNIVKVLVDAEKLPKEALFNRTEKDIESKISALGTLKSDISKFQDALAKLQDPDSLNARSVSTGESKFLTATADKFATTGNYAITVEQLAKAHKVAGTHVTDPKQTVGEGSLDLEVNGKAFSVDIAADDDLYAIARKVNDDADNSGVTATIITSDSGSRLVFSSNESGSDNQVTVTATDTTGTGLNDMFGGANLETLQAAQNAVLTIDGQKVTSQTNEIKDAIQGVTLNLTDADVNETTTLSITSDKDAVKDNVKGFVDAYNALTSSIDKLSAYDMEKEEAAALQGDSMVRSLESQLRSMVSSRIETADGGSIALYDIGIKVDRNGKMEIDDTKLDANIANNMEGLEALFATPDTGLANRLDNLAEGYVKTGGLIDSKDTSLDSDKQRVDDQREVFARKMTMLESRLMKQFNAMDLLVGQLNAQSAGLADKLNSLPGVLG